MLDRIQNDYNLFRKKEFTFELRDNTIIKLQFKKCNLPHLIGIGKLYKDDITIKKFRDKEINPKDILKKLKEENKTYEVLSLYPTWTQHLSQRMTNFTADNLELLIRQSSVIDFVYDSCKTKNEKAKFVFYSKKQDIHLHLFIGEDKNDHYYFPNSFSAEFEKNHNLGNTKKIKVSRIKIKGCESTIIIDHDYNKGKIRETEQKIKEANCLNIKIKNQLRENVLKENITEIKELVNLLDEIKNNYKIIDVYIPLRIFFQQEENEKLKKFYNNMCRGSYSY